MSIRALLIDDDLRLHELLDGYLVAGGVVVDHARDGVHGLSMLAGGAHDVVLLDVMMPGVDGLSVLRSIRQRSTVPVIMLTARGDEADRVVGLELGADDYVAKPFSPRELLARVRAVLRRAHPEVGAERLLVDGLLVDLGSRSVEAGGVAVELTGLEFDLLVALMRRAGRVVPRAALLSEAGRDDVTVSERTVDVHISRLRKKVGAERIKTVRGVGYVLGRGED